MQRTWKTHHCDVVETKQSAGEYLNAVWTSQSVDQQQSVIVKVHEIERRWAVDTAHSVVVASSQSIPAG